MRADVLAMAGMQSIWRQLSPFEFACTSFGYTTRRRRAPAAII